MSCNYIIKERDFESDKDLILKDIISWQIPCYKTHFILFQWLSSTKSSHGGRLHLRLGEQHWFWEVGIGI